MVIKKQPVISWLFEDPFTDFNKIGVPMTPNIKNFGYLSNGFSVLAEIRSKKPDWGLPELLMPSFKEIMSKSAKAFYNIDNQLFQYVFRTKSVHLFR